MATIEHRRSPVPPALVSGTLVVAGVDLTSKATAPLLADLAPRWVQPMTNSDLALGAATAAAPLLVLLMAAGLLLALVVVAGLVRRGRVSVTGGSLLLGGALGNLVDRAVTGAVHDFLVVGPVVINLADVAVLVGVLAVWRGLTRSPIDRSSRSAAREAQLVEGR
jgi:lipoprotein signal peptidase